ncbi:MAG: hypothetical protein JO002_16945 [Burkholderiaceae bacterium]|nr:hypothetical protein [Burkholderiaceae bacterium]
MGWKLSVSSKGFEHGKNAGVTTYLNDRVTSITSLAGAQWRFTPNADRTTSGEAGSIPAWQAQRVCRNVLSTLVGTD